MRDFNRDTLIGFRNAIEAGVVREPVWHVNLAQHWSMAASLAAGSPPTPAFPTYSYFEQLDRQPGTLRHWEHTFGLQTHPGPAPYDTWIVELARIVCADAETAVIKSFEQYYSLPREQGYCCPPWWGDPYLLYPDHLRWHLRVQPYTGDIASIPPWNIVGGGELPGNPHRETPVFEDLWFPPSSPASQNIHITVGARQILRVCLEVPPVDLQPAAAAKIRGFRVQAFSPENIPALKTIW